MVPKSYRVPCQETPNLFMQSHRPGKNLSAWALCNMDDFAMPYRAILE
jgi:hypothetical protein